MQQEEIFFFGKLNRSRDFIASENLQTNDKDFWDGWFSRCTNQDKLIPFTRKTYFTPRIWLFCVKLPDNITYIGITALSSDKTDRQYPFVLFQKINSHFNELESMNFITSKIDFFRQTLIDGKCIIKDCLSIDYKPTRPLSASFLNFLAKSDNIGSFWLECESGYHIERDGEPTCSLFNKIFGL